MTTNNSTNAAAKVEGGSKKKRELFLVTLAWHPADSSYGDYCSKVWSFDSDGAVKALATEMAALPDSGCETPAERARFVRNTVANAGTYAASRVACSVLDDCRALLAGPKSEMSAKAAVDFKAIEELLKKYGAS